MSLLASLVQNPQQEELKNKIEATNKGQIQYDQNMFAQMKRLPNLLDRRGKINQDAVGNVSVPMSDAQYLKQAQSFMPADVPVDTQKILADKEMINQSFDLQAGQQLANLRQNNTERGIIKSLQKNNPALLDYYVSNNLIAPMEDLRSPGRKALGSIASTAALYGGLRAGQLAVGTPTMPTNPEDIKRLRTLGYDVKNGRIIKKRATKGMKKRDISAMRKARAALNPTQKRLLKEATKKGSKRFVSNAALTALRTGGLLARMKAGAIGGSALGPKGAAIGAFLLPLAAEFAVDAFKD